jgi:uncharacterized DUF497 family protein
VSTEPGQAQPDATAVALEPLAASYIHAHISTVRFSRDPRKSARNLANRGFDFAFAVGVFTGPTVERTDARKEYGELRRVAIGRFAPSRSPWCIPIGRPTTARRNVTSSLPE